MFQPGEEGHAGARYMLDEGLLDTTDERPSSCFAIHVSSAYTSGEVHIRPGSQMASADEIEITVHGRGGHASAPHMALDPVPIAAEILLAIQAAVTRRINVFDPAVVTFGKIAAGTTNNVIPASAHLIGTVRTVSEETRSHVFEILERVGSNVAAAHGATAELDVKWGYPVSVNDADIVASVEDLTKRLLGEDALVRMPSPIMGAEDWSYVMQKVPGAMAFLGACPPEIEAGTGPGNHSNLVVFDEGCMHKGVALYAGFVMDRLG
jgi:hippurate hydrolase